MNSIIEQIGEEMMLHLEAKGAAIREELGAPATLSQYEAAELACNAAADEELFPTSSHETALAYRGAVRNGFDGDEETKMGNNLVNVTCYTCRGTCLGHDSIEPGDVFESTSGNIWQVIRVEDREAGQYAEVFATSRPADRYFWHTDSLRLMRRLRGLSDK